MSVLLTLAIVFIVIAFVAWILGARGTAGSAGRYKVPHNDLRHTPRPFHPSWHSAPDRLEHSNTRQELVSRKLQSSEGRRRMNDLTVEPYKVTVRIAREDVRCDRCGGIIKQGEYHKVIQDKPSFHPRLRFVHSDKQGNEICPTSKSKDEQQSFVLRRADIQS